MFKHLLIPTDGTKLSEAAVRAGVLLAREQDAKVTGLYVMPDYRAIIYGADALLTYNSAEFERSANNDADAALQFVDQIARPEGVPCNFVRVTHASVYQAIVQQAQELQCDLICMASHGRKGIGGILLGSETQRVLTHSHVPVLVHRPASTGKH
ncbi:universal stress protein [Comamonas thiooxydans]|uniref:universal stress protein n=1 Tax=Comamonas thiooxydans TaxID=363952 RepID=UPI00050EFD5B|nr:universal stress protein [Comamonas thiooxydans]KGG81987.1 universal stress protein UspA [Comamonas thiooxydans]